MQLTVAIGPSSVSRNTNVTDRCKLCITLLKGNFLPSTFSPSSISWTGMWNGVGAPALIMWKKTHIRRQRVSTRGWYCAPHETLVVSRDILVVTVWGRMPLSLVSRDQGCYWTSSNAWEHLLAPTRLLCHSIPILCADSIFPFRGALCSQLFDFLDLFLIFTSF